MFHNYNRRAHERILVATGLTHHGYDVLVVVPPDTSARLHRTAIALLGRGAIEVLEFASTIAAALLDVERG